MSKTTTLAKIDYPFKKGWSPEPGKPFEVADGVFWLRMPLPIDLDHINLWLLKDAENTWTIVDSGYDAVECKAVWDHVFETFLKENTVSKIIITHFHPDHIGLAAWLAHRCNAPIYITKGEFEHYHSIVNRDLSSFKTQTLKFAKEVGFDEKTALAFLNFFSTSDKPDNARVKHEMCVFIADGDSISIGNHDWTVVTGNGHSPEHACLYCLGLNVFISGDQAIARISSNISVYPSNPDANPLKDWLNSCQKLRDMIPASTLILAAHQEPFISIARRMQDMIDDHHQDLARMQIALVDMKNTVQLRQVLFDRPLNQVESVFATGETLAHINYLLNKGGIAKKKINSIAYYQVSNAS